jgi:DedD protein
MSGYFDEDEELEREPEEGSGDTEVRLSPLALLGIFFCLVLLCGLCFGLGYMLGHRTAGPTVASAQHESPADQEPLQGNASAPKPSAAAQAPEPTQATPEGEAAPPSTSTETSSTPAETNPPKAQPSSGASAPASPSPVAQAPAQPAAPPAKPTTPATSTRPANAQASRTPEPAPAETSPYVRPDLPAAQGQFVVQIAAVSHSEDADVLVTALRRHGYVVTARREPSDGLIHVRIGPFSTHEEAVRWRNKLLGDGYNAELQP